VSEQPQGLTIQSDLSGARIRFPLPTGSNNLSRMASGFTVGAVGMSFLMCASGIVLDAPMALMMAVVFLGLSFGGGILRSVLSQFMGHGEAAIASGADPDMMARPPQALSTLLSRK